VEITGRTRVLIAGAGVAGLETALALRAFAGDRVETELLDPAAELTLAAESTAHPFGRRPRATPLASLAELAGARLRHERLEEVLTEDGLALTDGGAALGYDRLVVAVGARAEPSLDGAITFVGTAAVPAMRRMLQRVVRGGRHGLHTRLAFVVPAGPVWPLPAYELALQTDRLLRRRGVRDRVSLMLVTAEDAPLALFGPVTSDAVAEDLVLAGIALRAGVVVRAWSWGRLELASRQHVAVDRVVALPRQRGPAIPGLPRDEQGFVRASTAAWPAGPTSSWSATPAPSPSSRAGSRASRPTPSPGSSPTSWARRSPRSPSTP
jgi:sulfide:quinone oxidoreductase